MNEEQAKSGHSDNASLPSSRAAAMARFGPGQLIDNRYRVLSVIGEGGNGVVFRVHQIALNKDMALKTITQSRDNQVAIRRFQQEAKAASALDHPNLIKISDFGVLENQLPFLVMELIDGVSLAQHLKSKGTLSPGELLPMFISACEGLAYAHDRGVIHRDIKPGNIMILSGQAGEHQIKIVDFGIAKIAHEDGEIQALTRTGEIFGSPLYMSPEQCLGLNVDHRADIYSLGCVMYEALTGTPPFIAATAMQTMMKHTGEAPVRLSEASLGRRFPAGLERIILRMLEKAPEDRFSHALLIAQELRKIDVSLQESENGLPQIAQPAGLRTKERRLQFLLPALCLAAGIGLGSSIAMSGASGQKEPVPPPPVAVPTPEPKEKQTEPTFAAMSRVYTDARGRRMRRYHIPDTYVSVVSSEGGRIRDRYFDLPASKPIALEPDTNYPFTQDSIIGLDSEALYGLTLRNPFTEETMKTIADQTKLHLLSLDETNITERDIPSLNKLANLTVLSVKSTKLTVDDLLKIKRLKELNSLLVSKLRDTEPLLAVLAKSGRLLTLTMTDCQLSNSDLARIGQIKHLGNLQIHRNPKVTDAGLKHLLPLRELVALDLRECSLSPNSARILCQLSGLRAVLLPTKGWSEADCDRVKAEIALANPQCNVRLYSGRDPIDSKDVGFDATKEGGEIIHSWIKKRF